MADPNGNLQSGELEHQEAAHRSRSRVRSSADGDASSDPDWAAELELDSVSGAGGRFRDVCLGAAQGSADGSPATQGMERPRKKVGRPIKYLGNVNSDDLTDAERRRIKRRIANRESARRVRAKRQEATEEHRQRLDVLTQQMHALTAHVQTVEADKAALLQQLTDIQANWKAVMQQNAQLRGEAPPADLDEPALSRLEPHTSSLPSCNTDTDFRTQSVSSYSAVGAAAAAAWRNETAPPPAASPHSARVSPVPQLKATHGDSLLTGLYDNALGGGDADWQAVQQRPAPPAGSMSCLRPRIVITTAGGGGSASSDNLAAASHMLAARDSGLNMPIQCFSDLQPTRLSTPHLLQRPPCGPPNASAAPGGDAAATPQEVPVARAPSPADPLGWLLSTCPSGPLPPYFSDDLDANAGAMA